MNWQDEQRRLQEQYDRGEISAQEFRTRREQLFSAAGSAAPQAPQQQAPDSTQAMRPVAPPAPGQQSPERTQAVQPGGDSDPDRTQFVAGGGWQSQQPGAFGGPTQADQPPAEEAPPWSGSEFPPLVAPGSSEWSSQGPEVFAQQKGGKGKIIAVIVAIVVLAGLGFGGYMLWGRDGGENPQAHGHGNGGGKAAAGSSAPVKPAAPTKQPETFPLGKMPAKPHVRKDIDSVSKFESLHYFTDAELEAYTTSGADKAKMAVFTTKDGAQVTLILAQAEDAQAAYSAAKNLNTIQVHNGRKQDPDHPTGVRVAQLKGHPDAHPKELAGIRAHYSHGRVLVRVDVSGKSLDDIRQDFNTVLAGELKVLSADA